MAKSKSGRSRSGGNSKTPEQQVSEPQSAKPKKKTGPVEFLQQVRSEGAKTTWPTRKETGVTTMMVFIMVAIASVFFLVVDLILQAGVGFILNLGS